MREIIFRAKPIREVPEKCLDDRGFVVGWYCRTPTGSWPLSDCIYPAELAENGEWRPVEIDPETMGQYTGLTDKNGRKIFEGDIVRQIAEFTGTEAGDGWETRSYDGYRVRLGRVSILPSKGAVMTRQKILREDHDGETVRENEIYRGCTQVCASRCEVVGNIRDNPELLK